MPNIYNSLRSIAAKLPLLRKLLRRIVYLYGRRKYHKLTAGIDIDHRKIFFASYDGASYSCSPKAIYEHMLHDTRFRDFSFIWAFNDMEAHAHVAENPRTCIVKHGSNDHLKALRSSACWVLNRRVYEYIYPEPCQIYVQCWHGTPLKKLGFDIEVSDSKMNTPSEFRWRYRLDAEKFTYMISPSPFTTEVFASAFGIALLGRQDTLLEIGYPRNDPLFQPSPEAILQARRRIGLPDEANDNAHKIILYAPTFRDNKYSGSGRYGNGIMLDPTKLYEELGGEYTILLRTHYLSEGVEKESGRRADIIDCTDYGDLNDLMLAADILICDYSSLLFDYANLHKPMIFFMPDLEKYRKETRGFYIDIDELPGEIVSDEAALPSAIRDAAAHFSYDEKYRRFNAKFNPLDDGAASGRLADKIAEKLID